MKTFYLIKTIAIFIFLLNIASCSSGGDEPIAPTPKPEVTKSEITIEPSLITNGLSFSNTGGNQSISFTTNENWTLSIAETRSGSSWCTASATSGTKGTASVKFTITENTDYDNRSVSVTIKSGTASKTFTITQKSAEALLVTTNKYEVSQEGGTIEIEVKANIDYKMEISEKAKDWIKESSSRALTTYKHKLDIAMNEDVEKREGEITFKSGDKVETVKVYQAGGAIILLSQNEYTISDAGETISVEIKSNVEFGVQMPDVDWITDEASSRGMSSHTLKYAVAPNKSYDNRSAEIIFYDKNSDLRNTLKVVQTQKDAIVISEKNINVAQEGGIVEVKVNTNIDFEVQIPSDATWITKTDSRALTEKVVYLKVEENTTEESRSTTIVITNTDSKVSDVVTITQQGKIEVVTLDKAGTLKDILGENYLDIISLKIIGPINGDDINTLRYMLGFMKNGKLTTLDLSEASVVSGGEYETYDIDNGAYCSYQTYTNSFGNRTFAKCPNLKKIKLPKDLTIITSEAFRGCTNLKTIDLPKGITKISSGAFHDCTNIETIDLPEGIDAIASETFYKCSSLKLIVIPDNVTSIGNNAFRDCTSLTYIDVPKNVKVINKYAFYGCKFLEYVSLGAGVKEIYSYAFEGTNVKDFYCVASTAPKLYGNIRHKVGGGGIPDANSFKSWHEALEGLEQTTLHILEYAYGYNDDLDNSMYLSCTWTGHFKQTKRHSSFTMTDKGWR